MSEYIYATDGWGRWTGEVIVRCRDCRYYEPDGEPSAVYPDRYWCDLLANYLQADGFCTWGKRKEGGE